MDVSFWTCWSELLVPEMSAKMIDSSEKTQPLIEQSSHVIKRRSANSRIGVWGEGGSDVDFPL